MSTQNPVNPQSRISDVEISLAKDAFKGRDDLLVLLRNVFFGLPLTDSEKDIVRKVFSSKPLVKFIRKLFYPEIEKDNPVGEIFAQAADLWMFVEAKDKSFDDIRLAIDAMDVKTKMLLHGLACLENPDLKGNNLYDWESLPWAEGKVQGLLGRNSFIIHINQQIMNLRVLANMNKEDIEETKKRMMKNSTK